MSTLREVSRLAFVTALLFASLDRCARGRDEDIPRHNENTTVDGLSLEVIRR